MAKTTVMGAYMEKPSVRIKYIHMNHRITKIGGGLLGRLQYYLYIRINLISLEHWRLIYYPYNYVGAYLAHIKANALKTAISVISKSKIGCIHVYTFEHTMKSWDMYVYCTALDLLHCKCTCIESYSAIWGHITLYVFPRFTSKHVFNLTLTL